METLEKRVLLASTVLSSTSLPTAVNTAGSDLSFNGTSDYLITPNLKNAFASSSVTVEFWFKANGPGVLLDELGSTTLSSGFHDSQIEILSSGQVQARVSGLSAVSLGQASFGAWHFVSLRYNSATHVLDGLLDGIQSATTVSGVRSTPTASGYGQYYAFGSTDNASISTGAYFNGSIDDITIWNTARTTASIQADMFQPPASNAAGLVLDYQLDDGSGLTAADATGNYAGSLGGGTAANAPAWTTSNAPVNGVVSTSTATTQTAIDSFSAVFDQALNSSSATTANNFSLTDNNGLNYQITPAYSGGSTVNFTISPEPLQPGLTFTFHTLAGLTDTNGNGVTPASLSFTVSNPTDGQIAWTTHATRLVPGATPLPMTQVSTGFSTALGVGTFANTSDPNYWYLNANAGDQLTVRVEAQDLQAPGSAIYPELILEDVNGNQMTSAGGSYAGTLELDDFTITKTGTYFLEVYSNYNPAEYQMRVDQSAAGVGPQLESTPGGSQASSTLLAVTSPSKGSYGGAVAGALPGGDNGDFYAVGTLNAGNAIAVTASVPTISSLYTGINSPPAVQLSLEIAGNNTPVTTSTTGSLNYTIPSGAGGVYYVVAQALPAASATAPYQTIRAQYLLNVSVVDGVSPTVTANTLPAQGSTSTGIINNFTVNFSEYVVGSTVTNLANYDLRAAGPDGVFGTADDSVYHLASPTIISAQSASYSITDGPLQPGNYQLTITGITDRAGNALVPYTLTFTIAGVAPFVLENRSNNTPATATPLAASTGQPDGSFTPNTTYSVSGSEPYFVASAALRGAGQPLDLVTANYNSNTISVLLGNGDGTFQTPVTYAVGSNPTSVAIGDLNGDGKLDLVVTNLSSNTVSVLFGNGDGTFQSAVSYAVGTNPWDVAIADLDGKNGNDLVISNESTHNVSVLLNQGNGTFAAAVNYNVGNTPRGLAVADLNGDGKLDIAVANYGDSTVSILPGNGDGTFGTQITFATGVNTYPTDVVAVDLNGDHKLDLATANYNTSTVSVLLNQGTPGAALQAGTFAAAVSYAAGGSDPYHLIAADLNDDGKMDLAVAGYGSNQVGVLLGNGDGTFQAAASYSASGNPFGITAGDFNGDGLTDLATANVNGNTVSLLLANTAKPLPVDPTTGFASGYGRGNISTSADVDYFSWTGTAGDTVYVASDNPGGGYVYYYIYGPSGNYLTGVGTSVGQSSPVVLPSSGTYFVEVSYYNSTAEYRFRVTEMPPTVQLATTYDDSSVGNSNTPTLTNSSPGNLTATVAGYISQSDPWGEFYSLGGNLLAGTTVNLTLSQPATSLLGGVLNVYNAAGTNLTNNTSPGNSLSYTVPASGAYYAKASAASVMTVSFWMNWNGANNESPLGFASYYGLYLANGFFGFTTGNNDVYGISSAGLANSWHLVTAVFVDNSVSHDQLWIDGVQQQLTQRQGNPSLPELVSSAATIGNLNNSYQFTGTLDEVAYFDKQLTGAQILAEYNARNSGSYSTTILSQAPVAYYRLGESGGSVAYDSSGNFDNATFGSGITPGVAGALGNDSNTAYQFTSGQIAAVVPEPDGLFAQYKLAIDLVNTTPPQITSDTLPTQGTTSTGIIYTFTLGLSEDLLATTVNNVANYDLRAAGPDGVFGTADDVIYHVTSPGYTAGQSATFTLSDGPLQPGNYQFTISGLIDKYGNALQAPVVLDFTVANLPNYTLQARNAHTAATATPLTLVADPAGTGLSEAAGRGALMSDGDVDYWSFSGTAGNLLSIATENLNSPPASLLSYVVAKPDGTTLTTFYTDYYGHVVSPPVTLPTTGTYSVSVHIYYGYYGEYHFRVLQATPPLQEDTEPSNSIATAYTLPLTTNGNSQVANVAGTLLTPGDLNYFNLGTIQAGYSILLSTQLPSLSLLTPVVSVYTAAGVYIPKTNGRPFDGVGQIDITSTGTYYALMQGGNGTNGLFDQYVMNVQIVLTSSLAQLPNLEVTSITLPTGSNIQSGQSVAVSWTVTNAGQAATNVTNWSDRAVLSFDTTYGNSDDIPLALNGNAGVYPHQGVLQPGQSYTDTETVNLPDGISGNYYLIVQTDSSQQVNENAIGRGDGTTVSTGGPNNNGTFTVSLAAYPDLVVQGLTATGPNANGAFTLSWSTVNNGNGAVANSWNEHLVVMDQTTGKTVTDTVLGFSGGLAANGGTAAHTEPVSGSYVVDAPGHFQVSVTTNSDQALYEDNAQGHVNAVQNDISSTTFDATRDLQVANLAVSPTSPQSGNLVTASWNDTDTGNLATAGSWNDLVTVVNTTTGVTLFSANVPYSGTAIQPGGSSALLSYAFTLPDGAAGVGTIKVSVTVNTNQAEAEYNTAGTAQTNNVSSKTFTSTLANYADLTVQPNSLKVDASSTLQSGGHVQIDWNDQNIGDAAVNKAFTDSILVQKVNPDNSLTYITSSTVNGNSSLAANNAISAETFAFTLPDGAAGTGNLLVTVTTDNGQTVKEYDTNGNPAFGNNTSSANFSSTLANYAELTVTNLAVQSPASPQSGNLVTVGWNDDNVGDGAVNTAFNDYVLVQKINADNSKTTITSGNVSGNATLAAGATSPQTFGFKLPDGAAGVGNFLITVNTDNGQTVKEYDSNGNPAFGNNTSSANFTSTIAKYPDLQVTNLAVDSASVLQSGGKVVLDWNDANTGNAAATTPWYDQVTVVNTTTGQTLVSTNLYNGAAATSPVAAGSSSPLSFSFQLPNGSAGVGTLAVTVTTNITQSVFEYNASGTGFTNNTGTLTATSNLAAYPDLATSAVTAPATVDPGQQVSIGWTLANNGTASANGPWTEQILLATDAAGDNPTLLAAFPYAGSLAAGQSVARSATVQMPNLGVGNYWFVVSENPLGEVFETNTANNTAVAAQSTAVAGTLMLTLANQAVSDAAGANATTATVTRNTNTASPLVVTLADSNAAEVSVPPTVTIPAGQTSVTFSVGTINGGIVVGTQTATLTASAAGLVSGSNTLTVTDVNVPTLTLALNSHSIDENAPYPATTGTITRNTATTSALVVSLVSNAINKLTVPTSVTIPVGQTSATFTVTAVNDNQIDGNTTATVTTAATGFISGSDSAVVIDDNIPTLSLTLAQSTVSEAAQNPATTGTVSIASPAIEPITITLTSSDTTAATVPASVVIDAGQLSASFPITAVDDGLDLGDKTALITANIETDAGVILNQGSASTSLLLKEADGPALSVSFATSTVHKGTTTTATLTRNTSTTGPLVVNLASGDPTKASVPPSVTIPAGQTSVSFTVTAIDDHTPDGLQQVQIIASATGFDTGIAPLGITDVDLPDLVVASVTAPTNGYDNTPLHISWTVKNNGQYPAAGSWLDQVYLDPVGGAPSSTPADTVPFTGMVNAGQSYTQNDTLSAPATVGQYTVRIVTDTDRGLQELSFSNNTGTSAQPVNDQASYQATVSTTVTTVPNGTPIPLSGSAAMTTNGAPAANVPVAVQIRVAGTTRTLTATTDSTGHYSLIFQPLPNETGHYSVTAADPGVTNPAVQALFEIVGMSATPATANVRIIPNTPLTGQFTLTNLGDVALTGLTATASGGPTGLTVTLTPPSQLAAEGTGTLTYSLDTTSAQAASGVVTIQVTTTQGAVLDILLGVTVLPLTPMLATNPGFLDSGMLVGSQSLVTFTVVNNGGAPSGDLQVLLPSTSYLSLASPATIPSLLPGASSTVTVELNPPANLALEEYSGTLAISNAQTGVSVPFTFTAITSAVGDVHVLVDDDYTFDEAGSPHVVGATVNLLNPYDNTDIVATGVTDATGAVTFSNVPAGPYDLQVQATGHSDYASSYTVVAGITNNDEVFIARQFVTETWDVVQTTIQDTYQIKLQTTFVTDVPAPVLTLTAPPAIPTLAPGQSGTFNVTITNHGTIAAQGVTLELPSDAEYTFTALSDNIGVVAGGELVEVPITVTRSAPKPVSTSDGGAVLTTKVEVPNQIGAHVTSTLYVDYSNTGTVAMPAPLVVLTATQNGQQGAWLTLDPSLQVSGYNTTAAPMGYSQSVEILASGATPGVLEPGESVRIPVYYVGWASPIEGAVFDAEIEQIGPWVPAAPVEFSLSTLNADNTTPADWSSLLAPAKPQNITTAAWTTITANLVSQLGTTSGSYVQLLDNEATYLGKLGENVTNVQSLFGFAVQQANNALNPLAPYLASATDDFVPTPGSLSLSFSRVFAESISGRDTMSTLGMSWSTSWQTTASIAADGIVTISGPAGFQRTFEPDSRAAGHYFSQPGDTGTLTADGSGGYLLTESDGISTDYTSTGLLNYMQDTDGNRITAGYTAGKLTSLTASSGQFIHLGYNAAGMISSITDSAGRTTTFNYDTTNTYLLSVNGWNGQTTNYTYNTTQNALLTIIIPGGTHEYFTYDNMERLASISQDGGAEPESFTYNFGQVTVTDGTGDESNTYYNENGQVAKSVDALGNPTYYTYNTNFNLATITDAAGESETYTYNTAGEVTSSTDFLGNTTNFAYAGPFNKLSSMTDANGDTTQYAYNSSGDLLSTTYADGSSSSSTFNPEGEATSFINANGQPINYTYNAAGQITQESFSDGSSYTYTYNGQGNMLTATDSTGTTTFTYDPMAELLTEVAYPNGMYLKFTYNSAGQRTQMVDQTGFTVNYTYDGDGQLSELTDGSGNLIVTYTYDADGRLSEKTNGNGTYTNYAYDADGNVLDVINFAPNGSVNSRFDYTYNALGLETTEATLDGTWTYTYDAGGQLTHAVFASTNPTVSSQDLAYTYDAMGNRITTVINGVTTAYTTNNMNEYISVGGQAYTYDADGNLISDGINTYSYNSLNQLIGVTGPSGITAYIYNAIGQQVVSTANGMTTQDLIDPSGIGNVVGQFDSNGILRDHYTYGQGLVSQISASGSTAYYSFDAIGSTVGLSGATGTYVNTYSYLPFGQTLTVVASVVNAFLFSGEFGVLQSVDGTNSMRARVYSQSMGQFLGVDPLGLNGGDSNTRRYANNNPINRIDPTGTISIGQLLRLGGALLPLFGSPNPSVEYRWWNEVQQQQMLEQSRSLANANQFQAAQAAAGDAPIAEVAAPTAAETAGLGLWGALGWGAAFFSGGLLLGAGLEEAGIDFGVHLPINWDPLLDLIYPPVAPRGTPGGDDFVNGACTVPYVVNGSYMCGNNDVPVQGIALSSVPARDCTTNDVESTLSFLGLGGGGGGGGGSGGGSGGGGGGGGGGSTGGGSGNGGGGFTPIGSSPVPPPILSTTNCNPVINNIDQELTQAGSDGGDPPVDTYQAVMGTDAEANTASPPNNVSPVSFIATAFGNLGLISGQSGNAADTLVDLAQMAATIATFDQVEADIAGIIQTTSIAGGTVDIAADVNLLQQVDARLTAVTAAENLLFGGDANWLDNKESATLQQWITAFFADAGDASAGGETITAAERTQLLATTLPSTVSTTEANEFLDRWNRTVQYWGEGIYTAAQVPAGQSTDFLDLGAIQAAFNTAVTAEQFSQVNGYSDPGAEVQADVVAVQKDLEDKGVCATVKLEIDQTATLTRAAFSGTLTLTNSEGTGAMTNVVMNITITDAKGNPANGEFFISSPTYGGAFINVMNGKATLPDGSTGTIAFTFIPDDSAASIAPTQYDIGGTIGFTDPSGGDVSIPVFPAIITVSPQPELQLNYFLQRDVIGDDPFTPQVEPSEPAVLGLLVTNVGQGTATDLSISTDQPQIVQNEKGLAVNFQIIGTQVGTQQETPSLTVGFGNIAPGQTVDADFLLLSSLQGIFTNFTATFTHANALGGVDTSLISSVQTHTLIHAGDFNFAGSTKEMDYLAEDNVNIGNLPDTIYFSDGTTAPVNIATNVSSSPASGAETYTVTANVTSGWDYIQLPDPGVGYQLSEVIRSDGTIIPVSDQAWTTDRTFNSAGNAEVDYQLHILDDNSTGSYTVVYVPVTEITPTSTVTALPAFSSTSFTVNWAGTGGTGPLTYSVYVSDNGGPFTPWLSGTPQTSSLYAGVNGHTYGFYSVATDSIGDVQSTPTGAQAITTVDITPMVTVTDNGGVYTGAAFAVTAATVTGIGSDGTLASFNPNKDMGTLSYTYYSVGAGNSLHQLSGAPASVGSYAVIATYTSDNANYTNATSGTVDFSITPATPTVHISGGPFTYDSNQHAATVSVTGVGSGSDPNPSGTTTVTYVLGSYNSTTPPTHAGTYAVNVSFASTDTNYTGTSGSGSITIQPDAFTYTIGNDSQNYGTPANLAGDLGTSIPTGVNGEKLNIAYSSAGDTAAADVNTYTINGTLANGTGLLSDYNITLNSGTLTVLDVPPSVSFPTGSATISEGGTLSETITYGSIDPNVSLTATINYGDGTAKNPDTQTLPLSRSTNTFTLSHVYGPYGSDTVSVTVADNFGGSNNATLNLTVNPVAPTVTINPGNSPILEGGTFSATGSFSDPGTNSLSATVNYGDGSGNLSLSLDTSANTFALNHSFAYTGSDTPTVTITNGALSGTATTTVAVNNAPINATIQGGNVTVNAGIAVSLNGSFSTQAPSDSHTYDWHVVGNNGQNIADGHANTFTFTPSGPGSYTVTFTVTNQFNFSGSSSITVTANAVPTNLAISPDTGTSASDGITDTSAIAFSGTLPVSGLTVDIFDTTANKDLGNANVAGTSFSLGLNLAEGSHVLRARAELGNAYSDATFTVLVDLTKPTSKVGSLGSTQSSDTFTVPVTFSDPAGAGGAAASGVATVDLYDSTNSGKSWTIYQTLSANGATSGTLNFSFTGQDRNTYAFYSLTHDVAGNTKTESNPPASEASTIVPDLNPPVTHALASSPAYSWNPFAAGNFSGLTASSYNASTGTFTINMAGADPDQSSGSPSGSIATFTLFMSIDGGAYQQVNTPVSAGAPNGNGVYTASVTYSALGDGQAHTYSFYSIGTDDLNLAQSAPATADVAFTETYTAPLAVSAFNVVQNLGQNTPLTERSYIRYLKVDFNQSLPANFASNLELLYFGKSGSVSGTVSLSGTTKVTQSGTSLFIDFGANGLTGALTLTAGTTAPSGPASNAFGDGWYALAVKGSATGTGNPIWVPFFRLLGNATGAPASGNPTVTSADQTLVTNAVGGSPVNYNADVNGDGSVNATDVKVVKTALNDTAGSKPTSFPQFQLFAGATGPGGGEVLTEAQLEAVLPAALAAWQAAGLNAVGVQLLAGVKVLVGDLGVDVLGLEQPGTIWINQTAAGFAWNVGSIPAPGQVDLLTVLEHELGHVVGLDDNNQAGNLESTTLGLGVSRTPTTADVVATGMTIAVVAASPVPGRAVPTDHAPMGSEPLVQLAPSSGVACWALGNPMQPSLVGESPLPNANTGLGSAAIWERLTNPLLRLAPGVVAVNPAQPTDLTLGQVGLFGQTVQNNGTGLTATLLAEQNPGSGDTPPQGGGAFNVLIGGEGSDLFVGGQGSNVMVGGFGSDNTTDNQAQGVAITGTTIANNDDAAMLAFMEDWTSADQYADRVADLFGTGNGGEGSDRL